jgi:hypothetical protein
MQITLPPELEQIVQSYLRAGKYQSPVEVLLAGLQLLQQEEVDEDIVFGTFDEQSQFLPLTESEMVQASLKALADRQDVAIPHSEVEAWANGLGQAGN